MTGHVHLPDHPHWRGRPGQTSMHPGGNPECMRCSVFKDRSGPARGIPGQAGTPRKATAEYTPSPGKCRADLGGLGEADEAPLADLQNPPRELLRGKIERILGNRFTVQLDRPLADQAPGLAGAGTEGL